MTLPAARTSLAQEVYGFLQEAHIFLQLVSRCAFYGVFIWSAMTMASDRGWLPHVSFYYIGFPSLVLFLVAMIESMCVDLIRQGIAKRVLLGTLIVGAYLVIPIPVTLILGADRGLEVAAWLSLPILWTVRFTCMVIYPLPWAYNLALEYPLTSLVLCGGAGLAMLAASALMPVVRPQGLIPTRMRKASI